MNLTRHAGRQRGRWMTVIAVTVMSFSATFLVGSTAPPAQAAGGTEFIVDSTTDAPDVKPGDHICRTAALTCTLRAAIQEANASSGTDLVTLPPGRFRLSSVPWPRAGDHFEIAAVNGDLDITDGLTVRGAGAKLTTVDGAGLDRVFTIAMSTTAEISDMTITGGDATGGSTATPRLLTDLSLGGGVFNQGTVSLKRLSIIDNRADGGGGVFSIPNTFLEVRDSLVANNAAYEGGGLRIDSGGEIVNTTITGNRLLVPAANYLDLTKLVLGPLDEIDGWGGGIDHRGGNDVAIVNSTITNNHAIKGGGGLNSGQGYWPISEEVALGRVRVLNTIIAGNTSTNGPLNCHVKAQIIESIGHNLDNDGSCFLTADGDLPLRDPMLAPLADNGGPTQTQALLRRSPAINAGATEGCPQRDQRGIARPQGGACDIGAFEREHSR